MLTVQGDRLVTIRRVTAFLLDAATATATMDPDRQPVRESLLIVRVAGGTTGSGTVQIDGTDPDDASISETLTFTANGSKRTAALFKTIDSDGITTTGLADETTVPTVSVQSVDEGGSPQQTSYVVASGVVAQLGRIGSLGGSFPSPRQGSHEMDRRTLVLDYSEVYTPRVGDFVDEDDTADRWLIQSVDLIRSGYRPQHWECRVTRYQT